RSRRIEPQRRGDLARQGTPDTRRVVPRRGRRNERCPRPFEAPLPMAPGDRTRDCGDRANPFAIVENEYASTTSAAGSGEHHVATAEQRCVITGSQVRFGVGETHRTIRHQIVEVLHHRGFGEDRQLLQRPPREALVKRLVERRTLESETPQAIDGFALMLRQLLWRPSTRAFL